VKAAILPLVNKDGMPEIADKLYHELKQDWNVQFDDGGAVGRRYRRQDEAGTPFCVTIDGERCKTAASPSATATRCSSGVCSWLRLQARSGRR
jgi:glycyl-tRNA synthetase (class II)